MQENLLQLNMLNNKFIDSLFSSHTTTFVNIKKTNSLFMFGGHQNQGGAQGGGQLVIGWYQRLPVITRTVFSACVITTLAVHINLISPHKLYLRPLQTMHHEYWRLITNFLFFGTLDLNFIFHMFFLVRYSKFLEQGSFRDRTADYFFLWVFCAVWLLIAHYALVYYDFLERGLFFLAPSLIFAVVYVWARRNPNFSMTFLYLIHFNAPWLPWVFLIIGYLLDSVIIYDALGIAVGHLYFFFSDVYPEFSGRRLLKTPSFLKRLFNQNIDEDPQNDQPVNPVNQQEEQQQQEQQQEQEQQQQQQQMKQQIQKIPKNHGKQRNRNRMPRTLQKQKKIFW